MSVTITSVTTDGTTLECTVQATGDLDRFLTGEPFRASYDVPIDDVPEGVLVIPLLAQLCPVAWATGDDVYVDEVDATFAHALADVEETLRSLYEFMEGGELYARRTIDPASESVADEPLASASATDGESGLLFTGGVDSTCSYVRHREESPTLISIRGWTITPDRADDKKWEQLCTRVSRFAENHDCETAFVESNMLTALDHPLLLAHYKRFVDGAWYSSVGHGLGLLGLCAPMAYARGISDLYVAATHWEGIDLEWGSRPDIDGNVRWTGTQCHHDGYELTRQERLDVIADYVESEAPDLQLQTCNDRMDGNCGRCEKCYRTAVGLRLAGLDPTAHGYSFEDADYDELRRSLDDRKWVLGHDERHMWADIRARARETEPTTPAERAFFEWLDDVALDDLVAESGSPLADRLLRAGARNAPTGVYRGLSPAYTTAKAGYRRFRSR